MTSKRSSPGNNRRRNTLPLAVLLLLSPYIVGFAPDSTSAYTETIVGFGGGQYVYHDCSGAHPENFGDAGITVTRKFEGPYRAGITAGGFRMGDGNPSPYVFPDLALDWERFSIGTTGLRFGSRKGGYFEVRAFDEAPFLSGKGAIRAGFGAISKRSGTRVWLGTNVFPYNNLGFAMQFEIPYSPSTAMIVNGRFGQDSGMGEFAVSLGVRFTSP